MRDWYHRVKKLAILVARWVKNQGVQVEDKNKNTSDPSFGSLIRKPGYNYLNLKKIEIRLVNEKEKKKKKGKGPNDCSSRRTTAGNKFHVNVILSIYCFSPCILTVTSETRLTFQPWPPVHFTSRLSPRSNHPTDCGHQYLRDMHRTKWYNSLLSKNPAFPSYHRTWTPSPHVPLHEPNYYLDISSRNNLNVPKSSFFKKSRQTFAPLS